MCVCVFVIAATDILTKKPNFLIICVSPHRFSLSYFLSVLYFLAEAASVWPKPPVFLFFSSIFDWHFNTATSSQPIYICPEKVPNGLSSLNLRAQPANFLGLSLYFSVFFLKRKWIYRSESTRKLKAPEQWLTDVSSQTWTELSASELPGNNFLKQSFMGLTLRDFDLVFLK